jgi:hypothetical protein
MSFFSVFDRCIWVSFWIVSCGHDRYIWVIFWNLLHGHPWTISETISIEWLFLDNFRDNSYHNCCPWIVLQTICTSLTFRFNYLTPFLIIISHLKSYFNSFPQQPSYPHEYGNKIKLICVFSLSMIFRLI